MIVVYGFLSVTGITGSKFHVLRQESTGEKHYKCMASNKHGNDTMTFTVQTSGKLLSHENISQLISYLLCKKMKTNKNSVLFVGHRQTVETKIRNAASDQGLHFLLNDFLLKTRLNMKKSNQQPLNWKWTCLTDKNGKIHFA